MVLLGVGIFVTGIGVSKIVTPLVLQGPVKSGFYLVALQWMPRAVRDWFVLVVGVTLAAVSLVYLNRSLIDAFTRVDRGDLAGILLSRTNNSGDDPSLLDRRDDSNQGGGD
jgi:hypothetical protein